RRSHAARAGARRGDQAGARACHADRPRGGGPRHAQERAGVPSRAVRRLPAPRACRRERDRARAPRVASGCGERPDRQCCREHSRWRGDELPLSGRAQTTAAKPEKAFLVGTERPKALLPAAESLAELARLADTAGLEVVGQTVQALRRVYAATFIGQGKVDAIRDAAVETKADVVIFDDQLSPAQQRNLGEGTNRKVIDRSALILDIFAQRARSLEGKMQV